MPLWGVCQALVMRREQQLGGLVRARREESRSAPQFLEWESRSQPWMGKRPGSGQGRLVLRGPVDHSKSGVQAKPRGPLHSCPTMAWRTPDQAMQPPCTRLVISQRLVNSQTADYRAIVPRRHMLMKCHSVQTPEGSCKSWPRFTGQLRGRSGCTSS